MNDVHVLIVRVRITSTGQENNNSMETHPQEGVPEKPVARVDLIQKMVELLHRSFHYASEGDKSAQQLTPSLL